MLEPCERVEFKGVQFFLYQDGDCVCLRYENDGAIWTVIRISDEGIVRAAGCRPVDGVFEVEEDGRIKVERCGTFNLTEVHKGGEPSKTKKLLLKQSGNQLFIEFVYNGEHNNLCVLRHNKLYLWFHPYVVNAGFPVNKFGSVVLLK